MSLARMKAEQLMSEAKFFAIIVSNNNSYYAYVPTLPGCETYADTLPELEENIYDAVIDYVIMVYVKGGAIHSIWI